ncbi:MAG: ABC transporter ATP-binding protein [Candidatus Dormibacteraceae bacterium]
MSAAGAPAAQAVALGLVDVHAGYDRVEVLHGVALEVGERRIVVLLGANGAGKTTTLRAVAGVLRPSRGSITLFGEPIQGRAAHEVTRAGVGHVPSGRELFANLSVADNLSVGGQAARVDRRQQLLERVLELFPALKGRLRQRSGSLSGGEQQMLAIGRALMTDPRLLLLDEPSTGLAPKVVLALFDVLRRLRDEGMTVLLVEQNARLSLELADYAYVVDNGEIVLSGTGVQLQGDRRVVEAYLGTR